MPPKLAVPPSASGLVTVVASGIGAPVVFAASVKVYLLVMSGAVRPAETDRDFLTGMVTSVTGWAV